jgi:2-amino-4-hydroxy-6-hydroxymethyldihydropteridine diphosphokinase
MGAAPITAYVGLGSNLGDRAGNIRAAVEQLRRAAGVAVSAVSSLLENDAVGGPAGSPPFLNAAAELRTTLSPLALLHQLHAIEAALGRVRAERWGPRTIDLDLLLYGDHCVDDPELIVPHPLMHERRFVLQPLAEIAPAAVHPRRGVSVDELLRQLSDTGE